MTKNKNDVDDLFSKKFKGKPKRICPNCKSQMDYNGNKIFCPICKKRFNNYTITNSDGNKRGMN